ncbi:hypothetical protein A3A71_00370 [Candidatus Berkelbacteria bacterium RIFCSPLOWO2_01_FULL_50_28]|uniref:Predicted membrane protein YciQ-like C-terminal domain-containing protein n=1 Tax=Candidatus Berkelbacteria bacterium RIFCSPLOWO2_01_FULL_50_28 TaxID=1797471 RepID=A0A1F5EAS3_9BACT|nr:MAG: hypothetical protein A2807_01125 [Candidatus Berkelbacteria bacterium RIFCSPHIGHO2_01_FULL_50_36]OGD63554.1 MAG: hypothetical protein A3F39_02520 [Candidatus Berkelbacteria bacterium RIFCSPHIGHO2_12_FULL_50_11]OGD64502.1 MAG: hypothetical protein A3A71_00370 [Candidatus Berkelbacteria bacterium RIFCSPLOWO2_01_FULL_50_28]
MGSNMGGNSLVGRTLPQLGLYRRSLGFFVVVAIIGSISYLYLKPLNAESPQNTNDTNTTQQVYDFELTLTESGTLVMEKTQLPTEIFRSSEVLRLRSQVVAKAIQFDNNLTFLLHLPKPVTEQTFASVLEQNGGAVETSSQLLDPTTVAFSALSVTPGTQLSVKLEFPPDYLQQTAMLKLKEWAQALPTYVWPAVSIALPALALLILLMMAISRSRKVSPMPGETTDLPSRLPPAYLGILLNGKIGNRELAATFFDLARRGHIVIRQADSDEFRFSRRESTDKLEPFESELLQQIFGPVSDRATSEEINFAIAQEVFSKRISHAFILAYRRVSELGFFYTDPARLHRRYQGTGVSLFVLSVLGFTGQMFMFQSIKQLLFLWAGMVVVSLLIMRSADALPLRTVHGDNELAKWLTFRRFLLSRDQLAFSTQSQEKYLAYLPYAIIFNAEVEWTRKFYDLPFTQPSWFVAAQISTIDDFANNIFPFFGYLSHVLALSSRPSAR